MSDIGIFYFSDGSLSVRQDGKSIEVDSVEIVKGEQGFVLKLTERSGKTTEYSRAGVTELPAAAQPVDAERVRAQVQQFFMREDTACDD